MGPLKQASKSRTQTRIPRAPPLQPPDPLLGQVVGSYTIVSEIGEGGMGKVYLARHTLIGRKAAIKILDPEISSDEEVVSRFFTEARSVNDIRHPNIVEVTDFGLFGNLHCIVMELLEGETLAARLERVTLLDEPTTIRIMRQVTSALGAAHEMGTVHRDLKPENIFLCNHPDYPDFVKVLDFGIAKLLISDSPVGHHTRTGSVIGTPAYMSPEQCLGEATLDLRSDIYSLGIVLYQMLTGRTPFVGDTLGRLIVCHVSEPPVPPVALNPKLSSLMNAVVLRALQKRPKDRYASMREFREALEVTPLVGMPRVDSAPVRASAPAALSHAEQRPAPPRPAAATVQARPGGARPPGTSASPTGDTTVDLPPGVASQDLQGRLAALILDRLSTNRVELPALPVATQRCIDLLRRSNWGFSEAAAAISRVPTLRSRIMRLANSAAFPSLMPATTLELAIGRLGTQGLYAALIEFSARDVLEGRAHARVKEAFRRSWSHALGVALIASEVCELLDRQSEAYFAYLAGILHDIGKPVAGAALVEIEQQMVRAGNKTMMSDVIWMATIEACHRTVGAAVARHWNVAHPVVETIEGFGAYDRSNPKSLTNILRFSSALAKRLGLTVGQGSPLPAEAIVAEGRALMALDDRMLRVLSHGLKERAIVLSGIKGQ
jgi:serine/threonine-protein kinase